MYHHLDDFIAPHLELVKALVALGADINSEDIGDHSLIKAAIGRGWREGYYGAIPEGFPAYVENPSIVAYLTSQGANYRPDETRDDYSLFFRLLRIGLMDSANLILNSQRPHEYMNTFGQDYGYTYLFALFLDYRDKFGSDQTEALKMAEILITQLKVEFSLKAASQLVEDGTPELMALVHELGWLKMDQAIYHVIQQEASRSIQFYKELLNSSRMESEKILSAARIANIEANLKWYSSRL